VIVAFWLAVAGAVACAGWGLGSAMRADENEAALYLFFLCSTAALILALLLWNHP
jgi:hypothetical protein